MLVKIPKTTAIPKLSMVPIGTYSNFYIIFSI
jgi:hypothetical protein